MPVSASSMDVVIWPFVYAWYVRIPSPAFWYDGVPSSRKYCVRLIAEFEPLLPVVIAGSATCSDVMTSVFVPSQPGVWSGRVGRGRARRLRGVAVDRVPRRPHDVRLTALDALRGLRPDVLLVVVGRAREADFPLLRKD